MGEFVIVCVELIREVTYETNEDVGTANCHSSKLEPLFSL